MLGIWLKIPVNGKAHSQKWVQTKLEKRGHSHDNLSWRWACLGWPGDWLIIGRGWSRCDPETGTSSYYQLRHKQSPQNKVRPRATLPRQRNLGAGAVTEQVKPLLCCTSMSHGHRFEALLLCFLSSTLQAHLGKQQRMARDLESLYPLRDQEKASCSGLGNAPSPRRCCHLKRKPVTGMEHSPSVTLFLTF